jgi:hypothetical protein
MAVSRTIPRKAPSQAPAKYFECQQAGGARGSAGSVAEKSASGPLREKIWGKAKLGKTNQ